MPARGSACGASAAGGGALALFALQRLFRRTDKDGEEVRATLARIEIKLNDVHTEQRLQSGQIAALEKSFEHIQERVNGGLSDHRSRIENLTERVVIASKGRFDRAHKPVDRARDGRPSVATTTADERASRHAHARR